MALPHGGAALVPPPVLAGRLAARAVQAAGALLMLDISGYGITGGADVAAS